jgi:uncharacterized protein (TIGR03435 family)
MRNCRSLLTTPSLVALAVAFFASAIAQPFRAQSTAVQAQAAQPTTVPEWQIDAGGKQTFEVASVKPNKGRPPLVAPRSNVQLDAGDAYPLNAGLFRATDWPVIKYIQFAYKITDYQYRALVSQMPKWVITTPDWFDIEARAAGNPTKDQMRLMMQALLADRFKLAVHWETRQVPIFALVLSKAGKTGPQLQTHPMNGPCSTAASPQAPGSAPAPPQTLNGEAASVCDVYTVLLISGQAHVRMLNETMELIASRLTGLAPYVDRPVVDRTGLNGHFDFSVDFTPESNGNSPWPSGFEPDPTGPAFIEALQEQTGLKLESQTGPVDVLVIDHVEEPSPN